MYPTEMDNSFVNTSNPLNAPRGVFLFNQVMVWRSPRILFKCYFPPSWKTPQGTGYILLRTAWFSISVEDVPEIASKKF
jgi:hypothetical protein